MRLVVLVLLLLTLYLQYALWFTRGGIRDVDKLKQEVAEQEDENARLRERNRALSAEVGDLKQGLDAVEERARSEMGMIKSHEVFFRMTEQERNAADAASAVHTPSPPAVKAGASTNEPALEPPLDPLAPSDAAPPPAVGTVSATAAAVAAPTPKIAVKPAPSPKTVLMPGKPLATKLPAAVPVTPARSASRAVPKPPAAAAKMVSPVSLPRSLLSAPSPAVMPGAVPRGAH